MIAADSKRGMAMHDITLRALTRSVAEEAGQ